MFKKAKNQIKKFWAWRMHVAKTKKDLVVGSMAGRLLFIGAALGIMAVIAPPAIVVVPVAFASAIAGGIAGMLVVRSYKNRKNKSAVKKSAKTATPQNTPATKSKLSHASAGNKFNVPANNNAPVYVMLNAKPAAVPKGPKAGSLI